MLADKLYRVRPLRRCFLKEQRRSTHSYATSVILQSSVHKPPKPTARHEFGPPIVFMHGLFGSRKNNRSSSRILASRLKRCCYALDLRNHGDSPHHNRHDYRCMADDVRGFIEQNGLQNVTLIGHSMGAKTALTLALQYPELIGNVVAIDNAPINLPLVKDFDNYIKGMKHIERANVTTKLQADAILKRYEESSLVRFFLLTNLITPPGKPYLRFRIPLDILSSSLSLLGEFPFNSLDNVRFERPTLFIRASRSHYIPDCAIPTIRKFFPNFSMIDIDCGHWVVQEKPKEFQNATIDFLSNNSSNLSDRDHI